MSNPLAALVNRLRLVFRLLRDPRVPVYLKVIPFLSLIYVAMPIDLIPDMIPVLGQLDDLGIVALGVEAFIMLSPKYVVAEHMADIASSDGSQENVVDGEWHTINRDH